MTRVTGSLGRPIQGISQQPNKVRLDGQCNYSMNFVPDIVKGLVSRSGFYEIQRFDFEMHPNDMVYNYKRTNEVYFIIVPEKTDRPITIVSPKGQVHTLTKESKAYEYLYLNGSPVRDLRFTTIGDYTFIANPTVEVKKSTNITAPVRNEAVIYCQFIDYAQKQTVVVDGVELASYTSADGTNGTDPAQKQSVKTSKVASELVKQINKSASTPVVFTGGVQGSTIPYDSRIHIELDTTPLRILSIRNKRLGYNIPYDTIQGKRITWFNPRRDKVVVGDTLVVTYEDTNPNSGTQTYIAEYQDGESTFVLRKLDGTDFKVTTTDDADGRNLISIKGQVEDVSKLPPKAPVGMKVQIWPKGASEDKTYWLEAKETVANTGIVWAETIAPECPTGYDPQTMPVTLIREDIIDGKATFSLKVGDWTPREIGDIENNSDPSFIGRTISNVGLFQNRLYFTSGESISMSRSSDFFNFYRTTTQTLLDTDPYDMYSDTEDVIDLKTSIPFDGDIIMFSNTSQHSISGESLVTPNKPVPVRNVSQFEVQLNAQPVAAGENIFFAFNYGDYTGIREFFTDSIIDTKRARPITDHVNQLIKGKLRLMKTSTSMNKLICQGSDLHKLYVYDWTWQGSEKVQSAWGEWSVREEEQIMHFEFDQAILYALFVRNGMTTLRVLDLGFPPEGYGIDFSVRLDDKKIVDLEWKEDRNLWECPNHLYDIPDEDVCVVLAEGAYSADIGTELSINADYTITSTDSDIAPDGVDKIKVIVGSRYTCEYSPSNPYPRDRDGSARAGIDRLQIGQLTFNYDLAGPCTGTVKYHYGKKFDYALYPRVIGTPENLVGFAPPTEDFFKVPIRSRCDKYTAGFSTRSHIPLQLREVEYTANYSPRGRSM